MTSGAGARPPTALYVHVPFCLSVCPYCDFVVYAGKAARGQGNRLETFFSALLAEIRLRGHAARREFAGLSALDSVYLGGGTPSLLSADQVAALLEEIERAFGLAAGAEITLEANPGLGEKGDLRGFRAAGVNRLSIGAQSMQPAELRSLGRRHSPADVIETVRQARAAGFTNLSLDLLYDVPGQSAESWRQTLAAVLALEPEHVSAYALSLDDPEAEGLTGEQGDHLPVRAGARGWRERARRLQDQDRAAACYEAADEALAGAGLIWYELSNWARPGFESRHNLAYWRGQPHEAAGPGAHAFDGGLTRRWNSARLDAYLTALLPADHSPARLPPGGSETVSEGLAAAEQAILALRTRAGVPTALAAVPDLAPAFAWAHSVGLLKKPASGCVSRYEAACWPRRSSGGCCPPARRKPPPPPLDRRARWVPPLPSR